jgi:hypothetical protein
MVLITIVNGAYKTIYNWGAPHCFSFLFLQATIFYCKASSLRGETSIPLDFGDPTTPGAVKNTGGIHMNPPFISIPGLFG